MKRRIFAMLLVLLLVCTMTVGASAAGSAAKLSLSAIPGAAETAVSVTLTGGEGVTNGRFAVSYDANAVTLKGVQASDASLYIMIHLQEQTRR